MKNTTPTVRLQFKKNVAYSIMDGLSVVCILTGDPNTVEHLRQRIDASLRAAIAQPFIRLRMTDAEIAATSMALHRQVEATHQQPLLDELNEAYTRLLSLNTEEDVSVVSVVMSGFGKPEIRETVSA